MSGYAAHVRAGSDRPSLYEEITAKIISELEPGRVPWVQPWGAAAAKGAARDAEGPRHRPLLFRDQEHGVLVQGWITFRQALSLGGNVRQGRARHELRLPLHFRRREEVRPGDRRGSSRSFLKRC